MGTRRPPKAESRRRRELRHVEPPLPPLDPKIQSYIDSYTPRNIDTAVWEAIRPFVVDTLYRYAPQHLEAGRQRLTALAAYAAWAHERGLEVTRDRLLGTDLIETFTASAELGTTAAANYRSRLRGVTHRLNEAGAASPVVARHAHQAVKQPYTAAEVAAVVRIANTQPSASAGRQLKVCVGLGLGAGANSTDLKPLRGRDVTDRGTQGISVRFTNNTVRTVWVRRRFEAMVRAGIDGVRAGELLLGKNAARRNVAAKVFGHAHILDSAPHFEQSRMRTTWLATLLNDGVPLPVIMDAAGLDSARALTDLVLYLDIDSTDRTLLRGGA